MTTAVAPMVQRGWNGPDYVATCAAPEGWDVTVLWNSEAGAFSVTAWHGEDDEPLVRFGGPGESPLFTVAELVAACAAFRAEPFGAVGLVDWTGEAGLLDALLDVSRERPTERRGWRRSGR